MELWVGYHSLPPNLKTEIWKFLQTLNWKETRGVDVESFFHLLPLDIKRETKQHLCSGALNKVIDRVPMLQNMDKRLFHAICDHLKPVLYKEHSFILREGDPLDEMLLITSGTVLTYTTDRSAGADSLEKGDFYGQELLDWVLQNTDARLTKIPFSTKTVQAHTKVELFSLRAIDLNNVVTKFWWLFSTSSGSEQQWLQQRAQHALQALRRKQPQKTPRSMEGSVSGTARAAAASEPIVMIV